MTADDGHGEVRGPCSERPRRDREVRVDELHRIARLERPPPREHLVVDHAERVEVGALVDAAVHAPRPLGRDVGQDLGEDARIVELLVLAGDLASAPKPPSLRERSG